MQKTKTFSAPAMEALNPLDLKEWNDQVLAWPQATVFHTSDWAKVLVDAFHYSPNYLCERKGGKLAGCLPAMEIETPFSRPKGKVLPFTDDCDFLAKNESQKAALMNALIDRGRARGWKTLEIRGRAALPKVVPYRSCFGHLVDLSSGAEAVRAGWKDNTKRNLKRAVRANVRVRRETTFDALRTYFHLHLLTRKRQGLFVQPFSLFKSIFENLIDKGKGFISLAFIDDRPAAGAIYLHVNGHAVYAFGASDKSFQNLRPNNLVMWDAIQFFAEKGFQVLDLGVTDRKNEGLRRYKNGMATSEHVAYHYLFDFTSGNFLKEEDSLSQNLRLGLCRRMPIWSLKAVGAMLYRYHG